MRVGKRPSGRIGGAHLVSPRAAVAQATFSTLSGNVNGTTVTSMSTVARAGAGDAAGRARTGGPVAGSRRGC